MKHLIAQRQYNLGPINGIGPLGDPQMEGPSLFARLLSGVIGFLTIIAALFFIFQLITGAIAIISAGGDKGALENARNKLTTGVIGIIVVIAAIFIVDLVATFLGIPNILDIQSMIDLISP